MNVHLEKCESVAPRGMTRRRHMAGGTLTTLTGMVLAVGLGSASAVSAAPPAVAELSVESALRPLVEQLPDPPAPGGEQTLVPSVAVAGSAPGPGAGDRQPAGWVSPVGRVSLSARFGVPGSWSSGYHTGLDFVAPSGTPVRAPVAGVVVSADWEGAYGRLVKIRFARGSEVWFAHLNDFAVAAGQRVAAGQVIGQVGLTGRTTGSHLHFEVRIGDEPRNPERYLWPDGRATRRR